MVESVLTQDDYDLTKTALISLGVEVDGRQGIPEYEELVAAFSPATTGYLAEHIERGDQPELTFNVPLSLRKLLAKLEMDTDVWEDAWSGLEHAANWPINRLAVSMLLNDSTDPRDRSCVANGRGEKGLVYVQETVKDQKRLLRKEQRAAFRAGVLVRPTSISQYVVVQAKRRLAGLPYLDERTATRFTQYPARKLGEHHAYYTPDASVTRGVDELVLAASRTYHTKSSHGVRRVLAVNQPAKV